MRAALLLIAMTGCWRDTPAANPVGPQLTPEPAPIVHPRPVPVSRCETTIDHLLEVFRDELLAQGLSNEVVERLEVAASESCRSMDWADTVLTCFMDTTKPDEFAKCQGQMSSAQMEDLSKRMATAINPGQTP